MVMAHSSNGSNSHTSEPFDYYTLLVIPQTATVEDVTSAFRSLALLHHPDRSTDPNATEVCANIQCVSIKMAQSYALLTNSRHSGVGIQTAARGVYGAEGS